MQRGDLVSDEIVIELIESRLPEAEAAGGAIFDGFPRTIAQAEALDAMLAAAARKIDLVVRLKVDDEALKRRIAGRFAESGRPDDNPESFLIRLNAYNTQTAPLLPYYQGQASWWRVDGMGAVDDVAGRRHRQGARLRSPAGCRGLRIRPGSCFLKPGRPYPALEDAREAYNPWRVQHFVHIWAFPPLTARRRSI
jgi:adenylate kinase family enzyme